MSERKITVYHMANSGKLLRQHIAEDWPGYSHSMRQFRQAGTRKWVQLHGGGITVVEQYCSSTRPLKVKSLIEVSLLSDTGELLAVYRTNEWPSYSETMLQFRRTDNGLWVQIYGSGNTIVEEVNTDAPLKAERQGILSLS